MYKRKTILTILIIIFSNTCACAIIIIYYFRTYWMVPIQACAACQSFYIAEVDWQKSLSDARNHHSTSVAAEIATFTSWLKLWDTALDYGPLGTASLQGLYRELTRPSFGSKPCHLCDINHLCGSYFNHFISSHSSIDISFVSI